MKKMVISAIIMILSVFLMNIGFADTQYMEQPDTDWSLMKKHILVKGIYVTGNTAGTKRFGQLVDLVKKTELNAMVIDVKDDDGLMTYASTLSSVSFAGANAQVRLKKPDNMLKTLNLSKIYPIARIVTFKDRRAGDRFPQLAVKSKSGGIWRDRHGMSWLNPYNKEAWNYVVSIAEEAAVMGFKEIQFDYVRFPTDGDLQSIDYGVAGNGVAGNGKSREQAIADFLAYARERLNRKGVVVSADVFGLVTTVKGDMHIGQTLESIAANTDVLSPMVYPSHYAKGSYGVSEPDFQPYDIVSKSLKIAQGRIASMNNDSQKARIRPWLQDFTASYLPRHKDYGPAEVRAQIKAAYDNGIKEWILWNAGNKYTAGALESE